MRSNNKLIHTNVVLHILRSVKQTKVRTANVNLIKLEINLDKKKINLFVIVKTHMLNDNESSLPDKVAAVQDLQGRSKRTLGSMIEGGVIDKRQDGIHERLADLLLFHWHRSRRRSNCCPLH